MRTASTPISSSSSSCSGWRTQTRPRGSCRPGRRRELAGRLHVHLEGAEVAIVDADHFRADLQRALEVILVVDLDDAVEVELDRLLVEEVEILVGEAGDDQEHGVGTGNRRLPQLIRVDDEVLAQDRKVGRGRACCRSPSEPRKRWGSVSTEMAAAPPSS